MKLIDEIISLTEARMKILKIDGKEVDGTLLAGGYGVRVYSVGNDLVIQKGKNNNVFEESHKDYKLIMDYVNLRYQPKEKHEAIQNNFKELVDGL